MDSDVALRQELDSFYREPVWAGSSPGTAKFQVRGAQVGQPMARVTPRDLNYPNDDRQDIKRHPERR